MELFKVCNRNTQNLKIVPSGYVPVTNAYISGYVPVTNAYISININWLYSIY
jgi:hypothetical protein